MLETLILGLRYCKDLLQNHIMKYLVQQKKRGPSNGLIIKDGYIIGSWGDTKRVDMTFSVTKSYLSAVTGIAIDKG